MNTNDDQYTRLTIVTNFQVQSNTRVLDHHNTKRMHYDYDHISLVHFFFPSYSFLFRLAIHRYHCITYINFFFFFSFLARIKNSVIFFFFFVSFVFMYVELEPIFFFCFDCIVYVVGEC